MSVIVITAVQIIGGVKTLTCELDGTYENHPETLRFLDDLYAKSGWNSEKREVYYRV